MVNGELQKTLGRNLRKCRAELGFSQEKFGEHLGFHRTYIGAIERGEKNFSLRALEDLATLLKVDPIDLLRA